MGTRIQALALMLAGSTFFVGNSSALAQTPSVDMSLNETLYRSVCQRVQTPVVFSTRDTLFALSLPTDEPARIYLELTVGKNGKVKEKLTRVHANHIAGYVAPAFVAATKDLRVDRSLLSEMQGKDTSLILTFPLEYQCVYDTVNKAQLEVPDLYTTLPFNQTKWSRSGYMEAPMTVKERERAIERHFGGYSSLKYRYWDSDLSRVWYYLAFIKGQQQ